MSAASQPPTPRNRDTHGADALTSVQDMPSPSTQVLPRSPVRGLKRWRPVATWTILGINVLIWGVDGLVRLWASWQWGTPYPSVLLELGAKNNELILAGQIWRLVTPIFLHVGILHLASNSYAMYMIAPQVECFYGPYRFLSIYLLSGIYGVLGSFAFSTQPSAGASGAIFGLISTQAVFFYRYRRALGERGRKQFYSTLVVIAFILILTFTAQGIDMWGHIGGLLVGAVLAPSLAPQYALTTTETGAMLVDRSRPEHWGMTVLGATAVLIIGVWMTIAAQTTGP